MPYIEIGEPVGRCRYCGALLWSGTGRIGPLDDSGTITCYKAPGREHETEEES